MTSDSNDAAGLPATRTAGIETACRVFNCDELLAQHHDSHMLTRLVRRGTLVRVAQGFYARATKWAEASSREQHIARAVAFARRYPGTQFSHVTAAVLHNLPWWGRIPERLHSVTGRGGTSRSAPAILRHRIDEDDCPQHIGGVEVTSLARTVFDVACVAPLVIGLTCADAALGRRLLSARDLADQLARFPARKGSIKARLVMELADAQIESPGESACHAVIHKLGFVRPVLQQHFWDSQGYIGRGDFFWDEQQVLLEYDGETKYLDEKMRGNRTASQAVLDEKVREDRIRALGIDVVRAVRADVRDPRVLEEKLAKRGVPRRIG